MQIDAFPFDPTTGPGYVWHCHFLEHEDNEMLRPYIVTQTSGAAISNELIVATVVLIVVITLVYVGFKIFQSRARRTRHSHG